MDSSSNAASAPVIARSVSDEAIQKPRRATRLGCFARLAMTVKLDCENVVNGSKP
jgi:hypothetical protein